MDRAKALMIFSYYKRDMLRIAYGNLPDRLPLNLWQAPPEYVAALEILGYGPEICRLADEIEEDVKNEFEVRD